MVLAQQSIFLFLVIFLKSCFHAHSHIRKFLKWAKQDLKRTRVAVCCCDHIFPNIVIFVRDAMRGSARVPRTYAF